MSLQKEARGFKVPWIRLPPSPPISERWFSRRRVGMVAVVVAALFLISQSQCQPPGPAPGSVSNSQWEALYRLNSHREGLPALVPTAELMTKAQSWSEQMARNGRLEHSRLGEGLGPGWRHVAENVAVAGSVEAAQGLLERSPSHDENMLNPNYTEGGVGVATGGGQVWVTQEFVGR